MNTNNSWCEKSSVRTLFFFAGSVFWIMLFVALLNRVDLLFVCKASTIHLMIMISVLLFRAIKARNSLFFIIFAFIAMYVNPARLYFFEGIFLSAHHQGYTYYTAGYTTLIFSLFLLVINLFLYIRPKNENEKSLFDFRSNGYVFWFLYLLACLIVVTSRRSGNLYTGEDAELSSLNEYVIILFLVCYIYSNNERIKIYALYLLYAPYAFFAIITGGRVEVVLLFLLLVATVLQYRYSFKCLAGIVLLGIWGMSVFGNIRHNPLILLEGSAWDIISPFKESSMYVQHSNEGDVFWASERLLLLIEGGNFPDSDRIESALYYFISPFVPSSWLPETADLSFYKREIFSSGGGNMAPVVFYAMFGFAGVIFLAYFISYMLNAFSSKRNNLLRIYTTLLVIFVPRWFAYNPFQLIKLCLWGVICYYLVNCIDYTLKKHLKKIGEYSRVGVSSQKKAID